MPLRRPLLAVACLNCSRFQATCTATRPVAAPVVSDTSSGAVAVSSGIRGGGPAADVLAPAAPAPAPAPAPALPVAGSEDAGPLFQGMETISASLASVDS